MCIDFRLSGGWLIRLVTALITIYFLVLNGYFTSSKFFLVVSCSLYSKLIRARVRLNHSHTFLCLYLFRTPADPKKQTHTLKTCQGATTGAVGGCAFSLKFRNFRQGFGCRWIIRDHQLLIFKSVRSIFHQIVEPISGAIA